MKTYNPDALLEVYVLENQIYTSHLADLAGFFFSQCKVNITTFLSFSLVIW